jgi:hypothetical protein
MSSTVISHSEVDSFLQCEQRHYYAFGLPVGNGTQAGLEPTSFSDGLYRGIAGHSGQEYFWKAIQEGSSISDAAQVGINAVYEYATKPDARHAILGDLTERILPRYFLEVAPKWINGGWRVKAVEHTYRLEIEDMVYPFTPDLILSSPTNDNYVIDHKFLYNFYTQKQIGLLPQIPKYVGALRALNFPIAGGYYNILRWRPIKDLSEEANFKQIPVTVSNARVEHTFTQQLKQMYKIKNYKTLPNEEWRAEVHTQRVLTTMICDKCPFHELCAQEIEGLDTRMLVKANFQTNTYGYSEVED